MKLPIVGLMLALTWAAWGEQSNEAALVSVKLAKYEAVLDQAGQIAEMWRLDTNGVRQVRLTGRVSLPDGDWGPKRPTQIEVVNLTRVDPRTIEVLFATHTKVIDKKTKEVVKAEDVADAYKVTYKFDDQEVHVHIENKPSMNMGFDLSEAAQVAENLNTGQKLALPPVAGDRIGVLRSLRVTYLDSTELMFRWEGPGNHFNVNEDGSVSAGRGSPARWGARGVTEHGKYDFTFRIVPPANAGLSVLVAPKFTIVPNQPGALYLRGEEPALTLTFSKDEIDRRLGLLGARKIAGARIDYEVQDYRTNVVDRGSVPIDFYMGRDAAGQIEKTIPLKPGKLGYFIARFIVRDAQNVLQALWKEQSLAVVDTTGDAAAERATWLKPDGPFMKGNVYWRNAFIGLGLVREQIQASAVYDFEKGALTTNGIAKLDKFFAERNQLAKETGVPFHTMFGDERFARTPQDAYRYYKAVLERYGKACRVWETVNEPNIVMKPADYLELYLKPLKLAAKEVAPDITILGPSGCGPSIDFIRELYKLGAKEYWDGISIHPYLSGNYDIEVRSVIDTIRGIMREYGDAQKPIYFTEGGFGWSGLNSQVRCARQNVRRLLMQDAYGIPKEQDFYYFTTEMGYYQFYVMNSNGSLLPQAVALCNNHVQLAGTAYARHFDFGIEWANANVYTNPSQQVAVVWTFDCRRPLQLKSSVAPAKIVDMWGNPVAATFADGKITIPASGEPTYIQLAGDAKIEPVSIAPGRKVSDLALGADATASSEEEPVGQVLDGIRFKNGWRAATPRRGADWVEIALPYSTPVDRLMIYGPMTDKGATYRDLDVWARVTGTTNYVKLAEARNNTDALLDLALQPVTTDRVRVEVLAGNTAQTEIQEIEIYSTGAGAEQKYVNWALAANGGTATASSTLKIEAEVPADEPDRKNPMMPVTSKRVKKVYEWSPAHAIDGVFAVASADWQAYAATTWIDGTPGQFPDWLQVDFAGEKEINVVIVFSNNFHHWKPAETGISDCELQIWDGAAWKKAGEIKGSKKGVLSFPLQPAVKTSRIRLVINDSNDYLHAAVMEIQALGLAK